MLYIIAKETILIREAFFLNLILKLSYLESYKVKYQRSTKVRRIRIFPVFKKRFCFFSSKSKITNVHDLDTSKKLMILNVANLRFH